MFFRLYIIVLSVNIVLFLLINNILLILNCNFLGVVNFLKSLKSIPNKYFNSLSIETPNDILSNTIF